uniref:Uncharacterized protein n=1 Tax=Meloidogyne enterolobii TaxID=390850 RepID=A0A6V7U0N6_MELEN|nr:unnamed protein product [Meloidogyne enterolobii]
MEIVSEAHKGPCFEFRYQTIELEGEILEIDQMTAQMKKLDENILTNLTFLTLTVPKISSHSFHHLVLNNVTDSITHTHISSALRASEITFKIHTKDTELLVTPSDAWGQVREEIEKQIFGDWSKLWRGTITILVLIVFVEMLLRIFFILRASYVVKKPIKIIKEDTKSETNEMPELKFTPIQIIPTQLNRKPKQEQVNELTGHNGASSIFSAIVQANINATPVRCLIDTGSTVTVAPRSLATQIACKITPAKMEAISASGHVIAANEKGEAILSIADTQIKITLNFVDDNRFANKDYKILLGGDSLCKFHLVAFDYDNKRLMLNGKWLEALNENKLARGLRVRALNNFTIQPSSQSLIEAEIENGGQIKQYIATTGLDKKLLESQLGLVPSVCGPYVDRITLAIINPTNEPKVIFKGTHLGYINEIKLNEDGSFSEQIEMQTHNSEEKEADTKYRINLEKTSVEGEELDKLKELLNEFSDIFSKTQYDLGSFTGGDHNIVTRTEEPITSPPRKMPYKYREELKNT